MVSHRHRVACDVAATAFCGSSAMSSAVVVEIFDIVVEIAIIIVIIGTTEAESAHGDR